MIKFLISGQSPPKKTIQKINKQIKLQRQRSITKAHQILVLKLPEQAQLAKAGHAKIQIIITLAFISTHHTGPPFTSIFKTIFPCLIVYHSLLDLFLTIHNKRSWKKTVKIANIGSLENYCCNYLDT